MEKVEFYITEFRVSQSSMGGYGLDIILKSGMQLKTKFHDAQLYHAAIQAKDNLTKLKAIFHREIENILKKNPNYFYVYSNCELFDVTLGHILEAVEYGEEFLYAECMDLIRSCADEKGIEFDGYFKQRWRESADTIIHFDEDYFDDQDRIELYAYLSALVDDEIFGFLNRVLLTWQREPITREFVEQKVLYLTKEKGVKF